jgi:hypothetical protein
MTSEALKIPPGGETPRRLADALNNHAGFINYGLLQSRTVAQLAGEAHEAGRMFFCTNETGGAQPVFSDGAAWRRCTDRAVAS